MPRRGGAAAAPSLLLVASARTAAVQTPDLVRPPPPPRRAPATAPRPAAEAGGGAGVRMDATWRPDLAGSVPLDLGVDYLRKLLQVAVQIEHSTIPPYMSALYSIPPGTNKDAAVLLRGIAIEEMLHMTNAANVLNAVGGHPEIDRPGFVPAYPGRVPFVEANLSITPFTLPQAKVFRKLEEPVWGRRWPRPIGLRTAADLYEMVVALMDVLVREHGEAAVFTGNQSLQVSVNSSQGEVLAVLGHRDAVRSIQAVVRQGEGGLFVDPRNDTSPFDHKMQHAHYYRCDEIVQGRFYQPSDKPDAAPSGSALDTDWASVYRFLPDTKAGDFAAYPAVHLKLTQFSEQYTHLLSALHRVFNGAPERFMPTVGTMYQLSSLARELVRTPAPGHGNTTLGPPWEWVAHLSGYRGGWRGISL